MGAQDFHGVFLLAFILDVCNKKYYSMCNKNAAVENMIKETYAKYYRLSEKYNGYISTSELLREGLTNRQIAQFVSSGMLEKV